MCIMVSLPSCFGGNDLWVLKQIHKMFIVFLFHRIPLISQGGTEWTHFGGKLEEVVSSLNIKCVEYNASL